MEKKKKKWWWRFPAMPPWLWTILTKQRQHDAAGRHQATARKQTTNIMPAM